MRLFNSLKRISIVVSSISLAACQPLQEPADTHSTTHPWSADELQLFTDYSISGICLASPLVQQPEPPAVEAYTAWQRIRAGYGIEMQENSRIDTELQRFQQHSGYFSQISQRAERYLHHVVDSLAARDMPLELALLPFIESAYDPFAYSHGRAAGMWQFIPGTATHFGLKQNWWYDGRRDIIASTQAALDYLQQLHRTFDGDWLLALAAYNGGQGTVARAIKRNAAQGKPTDFWSLELPRETKIYVPRLLALAKAVQTPQRYGLQLYPIPNNPYFALVETGGQVDLARAAEWAAIDLEELYRLNPGFNRWATDPDGPHQLLVPFEQADRLRSQLAATPPEQRLRWQRYRVRPGDSLITIARRHGIDVNSLREANQLNSNLIRAGDILLIASASQPEGSYVLSAEQRLSQLQGKPRGSNGAQRVNYTVRNGDSLWSISRQHGVRTAELAKWNGMAPGDTLRIGQQLSIWTQKANSRSVARGGPPSDAVMRRVQYKVRSGDSLARIAARFRVGVDDIVQWNTLNPTRYLQPGQQLTLHVDVTRID